MQTGSAQQASQKRNISTGKRSEEQKAKIWFELSVANQQKSCDVNPSIECYGEDARGVVVVVAIVVVGRGGCLALSRVGKYGFNTFFFQKKFEGKF